MKQAIIGFARDDEGHWVALLECGHRQHMRHNPPWTERPWVNTDKGRRSRIGTTIDCVNCDAEPPSAIIYDLDDCLFATRSIPERSFSRAAAPDILIMYDLLLFDLDGTISDPLVGIARSINHSLRHFGFDEIPHQDLAWCIGPPIDQNFSRLVGTDSAELIDAMIEKYRERFSDVGYSENTIYPGIREVLTELHACGIPMAVCTSKRADYARRILEMFELDGFFQFVNGGDVGISKVQQIERLLADGSITGETIMIGDRSHDIIAAHSNGLAATGVLWGYGSREELEAERPSRLLEEVRELGVFRAGARGKG